MRIPTLPAVLLLSSLLAGAPALAEKPDHAGGPKHGHKADKHERKADKHGHKADKHQHKAAKHDHPEPRRGAYFDATHRESVHHYYGSHSGAHCPPGLAKKDNGCMPPGQARKWEVGQRVPRGVTVYAVPQPILVTLPPPPPQHRYIRVAGDILLIAVGTQMVVDGISGLSN